MDTESNPLLAIHRVFVDRCDELANPATTGCPTACESKQARALRTHESIDAELRRLYNLAGQYLSQGDRSTFLVIADCADTLYLSVYPELF